MFGNHHRDLRPKLAREVKEYFLSQGVNIDELIEKCRDFRTPIPHFENLVRSTFTTTIGGKGSSVSLIDNDGEIIHELKKSGLFVWSNYEAHFEAACDARDRAVAHISYSALQECLSQGFASLDAFLNKLAKNWNKQHPDEPLEDSETDKVSLETKFDEWIPKMSGGRKIDKSGPVWNSFKILKKLRDDEAIHPKNLGTGISYDDLVNNLNSFKLGIAKLLFSLHLIIGLPVPSVIINAIYTPDVEVIG